MAAVLALVLSGAPGLAAAALGSVSSAAPVVEEHLEDREPTVDARRSTRARVERPKGALHLASRLPALDRGARPATPLAATRFIPPQRKTLLRFLS